MTLQDVSHGMINWSELMTTDPARARAFYGELLGWTFEDYPSCGCQYAIVKVGERVIGGIMDMPPEALELGAPPNWGCYITVDDVDVTVDKAKALGAQAIIEPRNIPEVGRFAVIRDPQGAVISFISYGMVR
ncbi:VOC family protein [Megalodesulfovibrio gigas]|uniref:Putative Glyoxalase/bleomycin resistance protein/dioxygenase n=1 Tax=Megalodesulfovibrio gigas (strain ATCC 19364 / DSM 1382 / NCIMB 9332 / VKM B-1759) TaxID=1121448 RepID=T2G8R7_MEGG1|nr:VOC family protein [Megalodesulfovibrio gigas]AGW12302.1 putative Glyoxalase/bleomycin resistance protein/dioxygenase [Megalodesulfovibrio gigas DSM 1382 = ATCC 19364]